MAVGSASNLTRQRVIRELKTFDSNRDPLFVAFVTEAVGRLRGPFLAQHPPKHILKFLDEAFRFSVERRADDIKVRIHEGSSKGVAIFSTMTDQPFIVDTIRLFLKKNEAEYWGGFNVVLRVNRDAFADPAAALANAEKRRRDEIASLRKRIAKLEALTFTVPTEEARL